MKEVVSAVLPWKVSDPMDAHGFVNVGNGLGD